MIVTTAFNPLSLKPRPHALGVALAAKTKGDHFVPGYSDDAELMPRRLARPARPVQCGEVQISGDWADGIERDAKMGDWISSSSALLENGAKDGRS